MKIGLVLDHFDPRRGGVEQWTHQLAGHLLKAGHEVHVIAAGFGPPDVTAGIVPHRFPALRSPLGRAHAAEKILRQLPLDVIHDMGIGWYCHVLQPHGGSRRAAFEQNLLLLPAWQRRWKRRAARLLPRYRQFDTLTARQYAGDGRIVLALSDMVRHDLHRFHRVRDPQIRLIYNGVDTRRFSPKHRSTFREVVRQRLQLDNQVLFLIVAHNLRLKGVPALLRAVSLLAASGHDVHLAIVGGKQIKPSRRIEPSRKREARLFGKARLLTCQPDLLQMARRLGVSRFVHFVGAVDDVVPYFAAADAYVQPTFYDPCSLVVLEALASGLPVITTRFNGAGELMTPGEHGYLLDDPADSVTLAGQMLQLLDPVRRRQMGLVARELALRHSFEENVNRVLGVYHEVVDAKRHGVGPASFAA